MALLVGPLHSDDASGKFAKCIVYAKWKGRNYGRQLVQPGNPKSAKQTSVRAMMTWLSKHWSTLSSNDQETWAGIAAANDVSAFNAFIGENMERWQYNAGPTNAFPPPAQGEQLDCDAEGINGVKLAATGYEGYAILTAKPDIVGAQATGGRLIFRAATEPTPISWTTGVNVAQAAPMIGWEYIDRKLAAGTYHYKLAYFGTNGAVGPLSAADVTAVVT